MAVSVVVPPPSSGRKKQQKQVGLLRHRLRRATREKSALASHVTGLQSKLAAAHAANNELRDQLWAAKVDDGRPAVSWHRRYEALVKRLRGVQQELSVAKEANKALRQEREKQRATLRAKNAQLEAAASEAKRARIEMENLQRQLVDLKVTGRR